MPSARQRKRMAKAAARAKTAEAKARVAQAQAEAARAAEAKAARAAEAKAETQKSSENIQLVVEDKQETKKVTIKPELNSVKTYTPEQLIPKVKHSVKHVGKMSFTF
jgi:hypothetical protein